jgi:hypothetical protein
MWQKQVVWGMDVAETGRAGMDVAEIRRAGHEYSRNQVCVA